MKLVFLGYMASGKSIIAKELAQKMNLKHIDLDDYIVAKEKLEISEIFKNFGEIRFRVLENHYLSKLLKSKKQFILSVGGGTPCYANNMELILKYSKSIYLKATVDTLYSRLIDEKEQRPLVSEISNSNLKEFIAKHLFERTVFYSQATNTMQVDNKSVKEIILALDLLL